MIQVKSKMYSSVEELPSGSVSLDIRQNLMAELSPGDIVELKGDLPGGGGRAVGLLVRKIEIQEIMRRYDDNELEYDADDLWEAYEETGGPWELLCDGKTIVWWPR